MFKFLPVSSIFPSGLGILEAIGTFDLGNRALSVVRLFFVFHVSMCSKVVVGLRAA